jgi:hypothetical protein
MAVDLEKGRNEHHSDTLSLGRHCKSVCEPLRPIRAIVRVGRFPVRGRRLSLSSLKPLGSGEP